MTKLTQDKIIDIAEMTSHRLTMHVGDEAVIQFARSIEAATLKNFTKSQDSEELALAIRALTSEFIRVIKPDTSAWEYRRLIMDIERLATEHLIEQF